MKEQIQKFIERVNSEITDKYADSPDWMKEQAQLTVSYGKKYARIMSNNSGSAWGFVNLKTGDLLKPAGWNRPAKHARGHISTAEYGRNYTQYGPNYLR